MNEPKVKGCFVGIDVSKNTLDIFVRPSGECWTQANNGNFDELCEKLKPLNPTLIVLEPTGGYELGVLNALIKFGFRVSREHAFKIHHHAKGSGQLAKTDRLDASMIAHYAECYSEEIEPMTMPLVDQALLGQLSACVRRIVSFMASKESGTERFAARAGLRVSCER